MKTQFIRLLDVFFIGPLMIWFALYASIDPNSTPAILLIVTGIATIIYNGLNFIGNFFDHRT